MSADLLFTQTPVSTGTLVFGESDTPTTNATATIAATFPALTASLSIDESALINVSATFPALTASVSIKRVHELHIDAAFPALTADVFIADVANVVITASFDVLTVSASAEYNSNTARPTVGQSAAAWQVGTPHEQGSLSTEQVASKLPAGWQDRSSSGTLAVEGFEHRLPDKFAPDTVQYSAPIQEGTGSPSGISGTTQDTDRSIRLLDIGRFQDGTRQSTSSLQRHQDGGRSSRGWSKVHHQETGKGRHHGHTGSPKSATRYLFGRTSRFQAGRVPPAGISYPPQPPTPPVVPNDAHLLFWQPWDALPWLLFGADSATPSGPITIPIQRVYIVLNTVTLRRTSDNAPIPTNSLTLSLDASSWTWGFDATLPGSALTLVEPTANGPVELEASINGTVFRVLVENISRDRSFGQTSIKISGRSSNAVLDAPYSPQQVFANTQARTSQQLMDDVLNLNGISLGYSIDYGLEPWLVPAGIFNHQGTYISALSALANAAGGYLIPHRSSPSFKVRHRYPQKPWEVATPDIVLPADIVVRESVTWKELPAYNRVYISGQDQGVLGRVTRAGTAGDILAPMLTDALITTAAAARQRGLAVLANTGRKLEMGLSLPVLSATGIIDPGTYVQYQDGSTSRIGIVRSTHVSAGFPKVTQTLGVEFHAA